jgi:hypothetical protein
MRKSNSIQNKKIDTLTMKTHPIIPVQSNSIMDSIKQGFGFGVGSEIGRKGIDAITSSLSKNNNMVDKNCEKIQEEYIDCIRKNQMVDVCEEKYETYEKCKKQHIK